MKMSSNNTVKMSSNDTVKMFSNDTMKMFSNDTMKMSSNDTVKMSSNDTVKMFNSHLKYFCPMVNISRPWHQPPSISSFKTWYTTVKKTGTYANGLVYFWV